MNWLSRKFRWTRKREKSQSEPNCDAQHNSHIGKLNGIISDLKKKLKRAEDDAQKCKVQPVTNSKSNPVSNFHGLAGQPSPSDGVFSDISLSQSLSRGTKRKSKQRKSKQRKSKRGKSKRGKSKQRKSKRSKSKRRRRV